MKKQQIVYISVALFVLFAFLFMTVNAVYPGSFSGYQFQNGLASHAGYFNEGFQEGANTGLRNVGRAVRNAGQKAGKAGQKAGNKTFQTQEGFHGLEMTPVESQFQTIVPYLDDARGAQCAGISSGATATGGPLCMTEEQQIAMASRGMNSVVNTCQPIVNGQSYVYQGQM